MKKYDALKLENQICFPLYACSKEVIKLYRPYLEELNLTYTQYIAMIVLWEKGKLNVKELGARLYLDSGTLTPVLKSLESKGFLKRRRSQMDERVLNVELTDAGWALRDSCVDIPERIRGGLTISSEESEQLYKLLYKVLDGLKEAKED